MKLFPSVQWHLLPGNHDPHQPQGIWERVAVAGLPSNIHLHLESRPVPLGGEAMLLPAPLMRKSEVNDTTAWMDGAETDAGLIRVGLAHGTVLGFGSQGEANNPIDLARPAKANLDYLALGDWHGTTQIGPAAWYAGTPEPDRAGGQEHGTALVVDVPARGAPAAVRSIRVGTYTWLTREENLADGSELGDIESRVRAIDNLSCVNLRLRLRGAITLAARAELARRLLSLEAAMFHLNADLSELEARPTMADLEAIDFDGVLRRAADKLIAEMGDVSRTSTDRNVAQVFACATLFDGNLTSRTGLCPMLITGITIEGVGKFQRPASVRGLGPGVNVLAAGNEAGKSTVFRAVRTCLFKRHNSNDQEIRNLACAEAQLPCNLALEFSHAGRAYEIRKTFVRSVSASLLEDGREIARGRDADEKVWELFGIGAGSGRTIDDGAFGLCGWRRANR